MMIPAGRFLHQILLLLLVASSLTSLVETVDHYEGADRELKGGKAGGGGGGGGRYYGTGGGGNRYNSNSNSNSTGFGGSSAGGTTIGVLVAILAVGGIGVWLFFVWKSRRENKQKDKGDEGIIGKTPKSFDDRVATTTLEFSKITNSGFRRDEPQSGSYTVKYKETKKRKPREGTVSLYFSESSGGGYTISGSTTDDDGVTNIDEGHATFDGKAFWKESNVTGETGLQVLNKGQFNFGTNTFQGDWWANTGSSGTFESFVLETPQTNNYYQA
jgi:hypothetical protein